MFINVVIALSYVALAFVTQKLTSGNHLLPIWPPSGLAAFAAIRFGWRATPSLYIGSLLGNVYAAGFAWEEALWISVGNMLAPLVAYSAMRYITKKWTKADWTGFDSLFETISFILLMGGLNGLLAAGWAAQLGLSLQQFANWAINDALSAIMFAPVLYLWSIKYRPQQMQTSTSWLPLALISWLSTLVLFSQHYAESSIAIGITTLVVLPAIFAALSCSFRTAIGITAVTFIIGMSATALNYGPYHAAGLAYPLALLQLMSFSLMTAVMITGTLMQARLHAMSALDAVNASLEKRVVERTLALSKSHEQERLRKLYFEVLSNANRLFSHANHISLTDTLQHLTTLLVSHLHLQAAWIGKVDQRTKTVQFLAKAGPLAHILDNAHISTDESLAEGRGPSAIVLRTQKTTLFDATDPAYEAWRDKANQYDLGGSANVPIKWPNDEPGLLTLYHRKGEHFSEHIIDLLDSLSKDITAFLNHQQTEQALIRTRQLKTALINIGDIALTTSAEQPLLQNTCEQLISSDLFVAAWVAKPDSRHFFQSLASAGVGAPTISTFNEQWSALASEPSGQTVTAQAWRNNEIVVEQDYLHSTATQAWRDMAATNQWHSVAALPIQRQNGVWATLTVIGNAAHLFSADMCQLLTQVSQFIGRALDEIDLKSALTQERLQHMHLASHDALTGLANRRGLQQHITNSLARTLRRNKLTAFAIMDLDSFKPVNDIHGHAAGDELLCLLTKRVRKTLRKADFIARLGGDEFVFVFEELSNMAELEVLLLKLSEVISAPFQLSTSANVTIGASMGVTIFPFDEADVDLLIRHADQALYQIKMQKTQRQQNWALYQHHYTTQPNVENEYHKRVINAFFGGGLSVNYQPIINLYTGVTVGIEALARLSDRIGKMSPSEFIPKLNLAEQWILTNHIIRQAAAELTLIMADQPQLMVAFNISPMLMNSPDHHQALKNLLLDCGIKPTQIKLELLEVAEFLSHEAAYQQIDDFKQLGIRISIDDMGSGYSSLLRLKDLPVDEFKIDQNFVRRLHHQPDDLNFIKALVELGSALAIEVVAEGVETADLLDALIALNVPQAQGHIIAEPMPIAILTIWMAKHPIYTPASDSLLGLYATHLSIYSAMKQTLTHAPSLINNSAFLTVDLSIMYAKMQKLGLNDTPAHACFTHYHLTLQTIGNKTQTQNIDWDALTTKERLFRDALRLCIHTRYQT